MRDREVKEGGGGLQAHGMKMGGIDNDCHESDSCLFPFFYLFCISRRHSALEQTHGRSQKVSN